MLCNLLWPSLYRWLINTSASFPSPSRCVPHHCNWLLCFILCFHCTRPFIHIENKTVKILKSYTICRCFSGFRSVPAKLLFLANVFAWFSNTHFRSHSSQFFSLHTVSQFLSLLFTLSVKFFAKCRKAMTLSTSTLVLRAVYFFLSSFSLGRRMQCMTILVYVRPW